MFIARVRLLKRRSRGAQCDSNGHNAPTERDSFMEGSGYKHVAPPELRHMSQVGDFRFKRFTNQNAREKIAAGLFLGQSYDLYHRICISQFSSCGNDNERCC